MVFIFAIFAEAMKTGKETSLKGSDGLMDKVSASQLRDCGFEPHTGHDHDTSYDTSTD